jgi:DNA-directed RNA polymerase specialized sigma24 family protein
MGRRNRRWDPPLSGPCLNLGPSMSVMISDDEKAGKPLPPMVELTPAGPPITMTEAGPMPPEPPPPPFDRAAALAKLQAAFAGLSDTELQVARMRLVGFPIWDIGEELEMSDEDVEKLWKLTRSKLGRALFGKD